MFKRNISPFRYEWLFINHFSLVNFFRLEFIIFSIIILDSKSLCLWFIHFLINLQIRFHLSSQTFLRKFIIIIQRLNALLIQLIFVSNISFFKIRLQSIFISDLNPKILSTIIDKISINTLRSLNFSLQELILRDQIRNLMD